MRTMKFLFSFAALFAFALFAGANDESMPKTLDGLQKKYNNTLERVFDYSEGDVCFDWYRNPANGHVFLVYVWGDDKTMKGVMDDAVADAATRSNPAEKQAVVDRAKEQIEMVRKQKGRALILRDSFPADGNMHDGTDVLQFHPVARSKGKIKFANALRLRERNSDVIAAGTLYTGDVLAEFVPAFIYHDSLLQGSASKSLPPIGECMKGLWKSTGLYDIIRQTTADFKSTWILGLGRVVMMLVGLLLIYLAIAKEFEPLLLLPIGFGALLANIPLAGISGPTGIQGLIYNVGIESGVFPLLIFMGVGAMTDFGPLLANPRTALLGGAAQFGIFAALLGALALNVVPGIEFNLKDAASIGIIGGADGPTSIFLTTRLSPSLLGAIAVAAYSYMALVPVIQPPIMKLCTTVEERKIRMKQLRSVSKLEKICFPIMITLLCAFLLPDAAPLVGMLMFGNLMRECGVVERLSDTAQNSLINIVTIFLGISVGSKLEAVQFLSMQTVGILILGCLAFCFATAGGVFFARVMNLFSKDKINPLIGAAGVSAVPMAARVANKLGLEYDNQNFLLMHAMGPNVSGVIGSAVAAGVLLNLCS